METLEVETVSNGELKSQELPVPVGDLTALEKRIETGLAAYQRILKAAIKYTHAGDWVDQNGKPYLMATGAERIARPFGVYIHKPEIWREDRQDAKGIYYLYICRATVGSRLLGDELSFEGGCSSRDKFFATYTEWEGEGQGRKKVTVLKPIEEVDEINIRKKAYTNMFINGITRLLGIRGLKWDFLAECGIKKDEAARVDYGGKGSTEKCTEKQAALIRNKLKAKGVDDPDGLVQVTYKHSIEDTPKNKVNDLLAWTDTIPTASRKPPEQQGDIPF